MGAAGGYDASAHGSKRSRPLSPPRGRKQQNDLTEKTHGDPVTRQQGSRSAEVVYLRTMQSPRHHHTGPAHVLPQGQPERDERTLNMVAAMAREDFGSCTNHAECVPGGTHLMRENP